MELALSTMVVPEHVGDMREAVRQMDELGRRRVPFMFGVDYEMQSPLVIPLEQLEEYDIELCIEGVPFGRTVAAESISNSRIDIKPNPITYDEYLVAFGSIRSQFVLGNSYLANLTFPTPIQANMTLRQIYAISHARYKLRYGEKFVVFSPECFIRIEDGLISSYPMKGTIDADTPNAKATLLADEKENAEHITIVDLIRNDLGMVSDSVRVERLKRVEHIKTHRNHLLQMSSEITGQLRSGWEARIGSILESLLPAGSITGAPKKKTIEIIREAEFDDRGYYTGVFGVFDGTTLESGVMIRFVEQTHAGLVYRSGGGLTIYSVPELEYQEMKDKIYVPAYRDNTSREARVSESGVPLQADAKLSASAVRS